MLLIGNFVSTGFKLMFFLGIFLRVMVKSLLAKPLLLVLSKALRSYSMLIRVKGKEDLKDVFTPKRL